MNAHSDADGPIVTPEQQRESEALEERIAGGTLVQQAGQAVLFVSSIVVATALGRTLSLAEFGVFGLVISFATYLGFVIGSAENVAIKLVAAAREQIDRDRAFTTAMVVYASLGLMAGAILAIGGVALLGAFGFRPSLLHQARLGAVGLGVVTALGWPARLYLDVLRANQHFSKAALAETSGVLAMAGGILILALGFDAPLWTLITVGSATPLFTGVAGLVVGWTTHHPYRLRPSLLGRVYVLDFVRGSGAMLAVASSSVVIDSLDRTVLGLFRSAASLGLYEAASRLNTYIRVFMGSFGTTLLPVMSRLGAEGDDSRNAAVFLRGTRYILCAVVPPAVTVMVLADRILAVWLGAKYAAAGGACAIFVANWLLAPNGTVPSTLLFVDGELRRLTTYAWTVAIINLALSLILTPILGLEGVVLGTTVAYAVVLPVYVRYALRRFDLSVGDLARAAWMPAYITGAVLAAVLGLVRLVVPLDSAVVVLGVTAAGIIGAWLAIFLFWFDAGEREPAAPRDPVGAPRGGSLRLAMTFSGGSGLSRSRAPTSREAVSCPRNSDRTGARGVVFLPVLPACLGWRRAPHAFAAAGETRFDTEIGPRRSSRPDGGGIPT